MKQKQVKTAPRAVKQTKKSVRKATPQKKVQEIIDENDDGEEEIFEKEVLVAKKAANKRTAVKVQSIKVVEESFDEEEEEVEQDQAVDEEDQTVEEEDEAVDEEDQAVDEEDQAVDEEDQPVDEDQAVDEEDQAVDEEQDDEDVEEEEDNEESADNEEPTIPSKIKSGEIPTSVTANTVVHITKLPKKCKQIDVVELFGKYGAIEQIHIVTTPGGTVANVAYKTEKAAKAALAANKSVKVQDSLISVTLRREKKKNSKPTETGGRSIFVRHLKAGTTEEQVREHFEDCGEIERVKLVSKHSTTFGFVTFNNSVSRDKALKLHNSLLNDANIGVCENNDNPTKVAQVYDEKLTVMVKNKPGLESIESSILESIFAKCGEIVSMDIVCKKNVLAFITFKTEPAVQKALNLNGKTEKGIELDIELFNPYNKKTTIYVSNLPRDCTEEDLRDCFSRAGEIVQVVLKGTYAIIRFEDCDAYCKSFLYNESLINNQMIFVEPHSMRKKAVIKSKLMKNFQKGFKRPAENGNSVFRPKKTRTH